MLDFILRGFILKKRVHPSDLTLKMMKNRKKSEKVKKNNQWKILIKRRENVRFV
jgi:hypothetical protein